MTLTPPMNPEVKQQWIDALRSGQFKQTIGVLNDNGTYCCLGVLCELAVRAGLPVKVEQSPDEDKGVLSYDGEDATLPVSVMGWADLRDRNPTVSTGVTRETFEGLADWDALAGLNDSGSDFNTIADLIEKNL